MIQSCLYEKYAAVIFRKKTTLTDQEIYLLSFQDYETGSKWSKNSCNGGLQVLTNATKSNESANVETIKIFWYRRCTFSKVFVFNFFHVFQLFFFFLKKYLSTFIANTSAQRFVTSVVYSSSQQIIELQTYVWK